MGAGYGLVSPGVFRMPYGLQRDMSGGNIDPIASLIGNALGTYQSQKEKQQADQLAARKQQDEDNWRQFQMQSENTRNAIAAAAAGLTTTPPATPETQPPGATAQPHMGAGDRISSPAPNQAVGATPAFTVPGGPAFYRAGPAAAEQRQIDEDNRQRQIHIRVGHVLASQMLGHDVDDQTAEGMGTQPGAFTGLYKDQNAPPRNIDPLSPEGIRARVGLAQATAGLKAKASTAQLTGAESRAAAQRLLESALSTKNLEDANIGNAIPSTAAATVGGIFSKIAGPAAGTGVTTFLRGSKTNSYQQGADRWVDAYMALVPKGRGGMTTLRDQIKHSYFGQEGDSPESVRAKATARQQATAALARAVATGTPPNLPGFEPEPTPAVPEQ